MTLNNIRKLCEAVGLKGNDNLEKVTKRIVNQTVHTLVKSPAVNPFARPPSNVAQISKIWFLEVKICIVTCLNFLNTDVL